MSKELFKLTLVAFMLAMSSMLAAQTSVFSEDFENGMPTTWQVTPTGVTTPWTVSTSGILGVSAYSGTNYLSLYATSHQAATKIVLPMVDITSITNPEVSFYLVQKARGAIANYARDTLKIYGRATTTAQWTLLATFNNDLPTWSMKSIALSTYAPGNVQLAFEYNFGSGLGIGIDNVRIGEALVCDVPTNLRQYRVTSNSAQLMWDAHESATMFGLKVSTTPLATPSTATANMFNDTIYTNPYMLTGLTPSTTYYYYVSAFCGGDDVSSWSTQGQFTTRCSAVSVPYTQDFNGGTTSDFNTCWDKFFSAEGPWVSTPPAITYTPILSSERKRGNTGESAKLYAYWSMDDDDENIWTTAWMTTPEINVADITTVQAHFYAYTADMGDKLHVGVMSDPNDEASFEEVWEIDFTQQSAWEEFIIPITNVTSTNKYIAFRIDAADRQLTESIYIDDLTIEVAPTCPTDVKVKAINVSDIAATITWLGTSPNWNLKVSTTSLANPATGVGDIFSGSVTGNSKSLTGLTSGTPYYVYIQPDCSTTGAWSSEYAFVTKAGIGSVPFHCDFESFNDRNQWTFIDNNSLNVWRIGTAANNGGAYSMYVTDDNAASHDYNDGAPSLTLATKTLRFAPGEYEISFDYKCIGEGNYDKMYAYLAPTTVDLTNIMYEGVPSGCINLFSTPHKSNVNNWTNEYKVINVDDNTIYTLVFQWYNDEYGANGFPGAVDNISITNRNCISPDTIQVSNIQQYSATATWTASVLSETAWDVRLSETALSPTDVGTILDTTVNTTSLALSNLNPATNYYLYVRSNCGADKGRWTLVNFVTACADITALPYTETFTEKQTPTLPYCWTDVTGSGSKYETRDATGDNGFSMKLVGLLAAPRFNVPGTPFSNMMLSFKSSSIGATSNIEVGVLTTINDATSFVPVDTITTTFNTWDEYVVLFNGANVPATGYLAFRLLPTTATMVFIDDVELITRPTCLPVTHLTADSITFNSASIAWTTLDNSTTWDIAVTTKGGDPDTATVTTHNTNPTTISSLCDGNTYDIYVRTNCGSGSVSTWNKVTLTTPAQPATAPYVCNFETDSVRHGWTYLSNTNNMFTIGTGTSNGGGNSMYVSSNGTTYGYYAYATTYAYAYRDILLEPGMYTISYDWTCIGESYADYGRAYLAPSAAANNLNISSSLVAPSTWVELFNTNLGNRGSWENYFKNVTITRRGVYRLIYYWRNDGSGSDGPPLAIDNVSVVEAHGCLAIDALSIVYNNQDATISWVASDTASYHVKVSTSALTTPASSTGNVIDTIINTNSITLNALTPASTYYVYVQVTCPVETKPYYGQSFTTPCEAVYVYEEDFESYEMGSVPTCWTLIGGSSRISTAYPPKGTYSFNFGGNEQWAILPAMASDIHLVVADFDYMIEHMVYSGTLTIGVMSDPEDISTFEPVQTLSATNARTWEHANISFANTNLTGTGRYIAFHQVGNPGYVWCIDDITVGEFRSCTQPESVVATGVTTTDAQVAWAASNALTYTVIVAPYAVNPDTVDEDNPNVLYLSDLTTNSTDLTGELNESTCYYVYVRAECGSGKPSFWSKEYNFTTACNAVAIPFVDNFNNNPFNPNMASNCWIVNPEFNGAVNGEYRKSAYGTVAFGSDTCFVMKAYYAGTNSSKICASIPHIAASYDSLQLSFRHKGMNNGTLLVGFISDPLDLSTFNIIDTIRFNTSWTNQKVALRNNNADGQHVAFLLDGDQNMSSKICYIDDVAIEAVTSCQAPLNVTASSSIGNEAIISLKTLSADDQKVQVRIATTLADNDNDINAITNFVVDTIVDVANLPLHVNGLNPLTQYYVYARVSCGTATAPSYSAYADVCTFTTPCGDFSIPFVQTFAAGTQVNSIPSCWNNLSNPSNPTITALRGSDDSRSLSWNGAGTIVLPNLDATTMQALTIYFKLYSQTQDTLEIGIMSDITDTLSFQSIGSYHTTSTSWEEFGISLASFTGTDGRLALRSKGNICLDELYIDYTSLCARPTNLRATNPTTTSVDLTWHANGSETAWEVVVVPQGNNITTGTIINATDTTVTVNNLPTGATLTAFVRAKCGANDVSVWSSAVSFRTQKVASTIPYSCDFEDNLENSRWEFENDANGWYIGSAASNGSATGMYISNNQGTNNAYNTNATSVSLAYRYLHFEDGTYSYSYDWKGNGESGYDFLRVFLAPETVDMANVTAPGSNTTPNGWIALDRGQRSGSTSWNNESNLVTVPNGNYYLVFVWTNDYAAGTQTPAAVDNINIQLPECYFTELNITALDTALILDGTTDCATGDVLVYDNANTSTATPIVNVNNVAFPYTVGGLQPQTTYYVLVRGLCNSGDTTDWVVGQATTACGAIILNDTTPYTEGFESFDVYTTPDCWSSICTNAYYQPNVADDVARTGSKSLCFFGDIYNPAYAITPLFNVDSLQKYRLSLSARPTDNLELHVGIMTNPTDASTFVKVGTIVGNPTAWDTYYVTFSSYTGNGKYIALRRGINDEGISGAFYIDDFRVELIPDCAEPTSVTASNINAHSADIHIDPAQITDGAWHVKVSTFAMTNMAATANVIDTVINTTSLSLTNLMAATTHYVYVSTACGTSTSNWISNVFYTDCAEFTLPFTENFGSDDIPNCWEIYAGLVSNAFNGTAPIAMEAGWKFGRENVVWGNKHAHFNIYGNSRQHWLVTPPIIVDTTALLSFDIALTLYGSSSPINDPNNGQPDDRFIVLVSRDGGISWNQNDMLAEWNSTDPVYSFGHIATNGEHVQFSLNQFVGDTIRIAFYGESTAPNGDNELHLNNVAINRVVATNNLTDEICEGYNYTANGFNISNEEITNSTDKVFTRISNDTMYVVTLTVNAAVETIFNDTICPGDTYTDNGFNVSAAGVYHRYLTAQNGCDSVITLNLVAGAGYTHNDTVAICQSQLPYTWRGINCNKDSVYIDRVAATVGCDSVFKLVLIVNPEYNISESVTIDETDLPYTYGDTTFNVGTQSGTYVLNYLTTAGCDSIITLNLLVTPVGLDYAEDGLFAITPNPAHRGEVVRIDLNLPSAEREGIVVELFSNSGALIEQFEAKENPIYITMPQVNGLYLVRVTLTNGKVMYGKVIVK